MAGKKGAKWRSLKPWAPSPEAEGARQNYLLFARRQERRLWSKAKRSETGCLDWQGRLDKDGYGKFMISLPRLIKNKQEQCAMRAHRLAYELTHGPIPSGLLVLHSCDNPRCVEPSHLTAGTQLQNRRDAVARGRVPAGEKHSQAKLTEEQAREVIRLRQEGADVKEIAAAFGIATVTVYQVGRNIWRHIA